MKNKLIQTSALALLLTLLNSCSGDAPQQAAATQAPVIETFQLQQEKLSSELRLPAELSSFQQVDLYAKVSGFVQALKVDIGSAVSKGQVLIVLEAPEISSQLAASESRLKSQEAIYTASKSNYNRLLETSKTAGTVSQNELEQANARKSSDLAQWEAAKASYRELSTIKDYLVIRAPFSGIVTTRTVNLGALVGPSGKGSEFPLLTIQEQGKLRLALSVPEMYTGYLEKGDKLSFMVKSLPNEEFEGKIARMAGALDLRLRAERIELDVENTGKKLLPGMVAEVLLPLVARESTFVIPKTALVNAAEGLFVIRVQNGITKRVEVKKGREVEDKVEIFGDLKANDVLVKIASEEIRDGQKL
jgi:membrane fusion protein (multidrug efflux system)